MLATLRTSALRLGLPFLAVLSLLLVMVPSASATAPITCVDHPRDGGFVFHPMRQAGPNSVETWETWNFYDEGDACAQGVMYSVMKTMVFPDGHVEAHGRGTFTGTLMDENGTPRAGTIDYRFSAHANLAPGGGATVTLTFLRGTDALANLRGTFVEVNDTSADPPLTDTWKLHWDPKQR